MTTHTRQRALFKLNPLRGKAPRIPTMTKGAIAASVETRRATLAFVTETDRAAHSEDEDLHPARLDKPSADLERALATTPLEKKIAEREARDA